MVMGHLHTDHAGGLRESEKWRSSVDTIRTLATEREAFIFPGHDTTGIKQFKTRSEMRTIEFWPGYEYE